MTPEKLINGNTADATENYCAQIFVDGGYFPDMRVEPSK
jgi:hypothetical protein